MREHRVWQRRTAVHDMKHTLRDAIIIREDFAAIGLGLGPYVRLYLFLGKRKPREYVGVVKENDDRWEVCNSMDQELFTVEPFDPNEENEIIKIITRIKMEK